MSEPSSSEAAGPHCPLPGAPEGRVVLAHGGGGRLTHELIASLVLPALGFGDAPARHDAAVLAADGPLAFTTDAYVVSPLEFPGGDIGRLAVYGTVNDLAVAGAAAEWLSVSLILEEGLSLARLERLVRSMGDAAREARVEIATGDLKVVERGRCEGMYVTTTGIGRLAGGARIAPERIVPGDAVIVSGDLGRHGIAVLACREGLAFETTVTSDAAPLADLVASVLAAGADVHCLRDLTRGGLSAATNELARAAGVTIELDETALPVAADVDAACEVLGLDPLLSACEGRLVCFAPAADAAAVVDAMRAVDAGRGAALVGEVRAGEPRVLLRGRYGPIRVLDFASGDQLPRIC